MADLGYKIYVTKGELATILGVLAYGMAIVALKVPGMVVAGAVPGDVVIEALASTNGIFLDNPEVGSLLDLLLAGGIIDQTARDRVANYVATALITESAPDPASQYAHSYRVPLPAEEPRPITWVSQFMTADYSAWVEGAWLMVNTNGACTAPGTEVV
jgi:hypothetical protein